MSESNEEFVIGQTIVNFRKMTAEEMEHEGWEDTHGTAHVLELSSGLRVYASQDDEGNGPGTLYWRDKEGRGLYISPPKGE